MQNIIKILFAVVLMVMGTSKVFSQENNNRQGVTHKESCTSIMVGKNASTDGSVMTSHTCDSWYRTWMQMVQPKDYEDGAMASIYEGRMHTQTPSDSTKMYLKGKIPQVKHTYRYLDSAYPCLNEKQLAMGETTFSGRDTLVNKKGMFYIEELQRIALERCTTARQAIRLMGELAQTYGYADGGECLTVADKNEVWIFEILGAGPKKIGAVWAARRIPDDHIAVSANISRISDIDTNDRNNCMASSNVYSLAKELGFWDGKEKFSFWKAYSGGNYFGEKKNYSIREFYIMTQLAPSLNLCDTVEELPLSVKPDNKVSVQDVMNLLASYYKGTDKNLSARLMIPNPKKKDKDGNIVESEPDSIVSPLANPWMQGNEIKLYNSYAKDTMMQNIRTVSVPWCAYSTVIQLRSWLADEVGGIAWVCLDNPGESPRFPIFCGNTKLPKMLEICGQHTDRDDAALWHYRKANRLATVRWGSFGKHIEEAREYFMDKAVRELPFIENLYAQETDTEKKETLLNGYTSDFFGATILRWDEMTKRFWRETWSGF